MSSLQLAYLEIKRLLRNRLTRVALLGICLMPLLYSSLYLYAFWDPYGKMENLPVAVVNEDRGGVLDGEAENAGDRLVEKLKANHAVKWEMTTAAQADEGLRSGHHYLAIYVPANFTEQILTATNEQPQAAELVYRTNPSKNYLATALGQRVISEVKAQLTQEINAEFYKKVLVQLQDGSQGLREAADGAQRLADGAAEAVQGAGALQAGARQLGDGSAQLTAGAAQAADGAQRLAGGVGQAKERLATAAQGAGQLQSGLGVAAGSAAQLSAVPGPFGAGAKQLAAGLNQLAVGAQQLRTGLSDPSGMNQLQAGARALAGGTGQLCDGSTRLQQGAGELQDGQAKLASGLAEIQAGNATLASKLGDAADEMQAQAKGDPTQRGEALAAPVTLVEQPLYDVPNYGTGFTPYFVPLSLWVGGLLLFFIVRTRENRIKTSLVPVPTMVLSKFWSLALLGTVQAVVSSWVLIRFLSLHPQSVWRFYALNVLLSWTFIAIIQLLVNLMGLVGRFFAIVLLMLQLTSCGGTYPLEVLPRFFQVISPYLPMTYATAGLRSVISGSATIPLQTAVWTLFGFLIGALVLTMASESRFVTVRDLHPKQELAA